MFVKCTEVALTPLRENGIRLATYIDNWLVTARSEQEAREHTVMLLEHTHTETGVKIKHRKECFNSHTVYNISGTVAELRDVQSATVRRQGEKINSLHD